MPHSRHRHLLERLGDAVATLLTNLAACGLAVIVAVNGANVIGRYFFSRPIAWAEELMLFLMIFTVFAGGAVVTWRQRHIRIDALVSRLPHNIRRWVELAAIVVSVAVLCIVAWASSATVSMLFAFEQRSDALEIPMWIPQSVITGGVTLIAAFIVLRLAAGPTSAPADGEHLS
jgi:TRAP-type C4-dicarboxylate transport system permease small subunit